MIINLKNMTLALIVTLSYEFILKLTHVFTPALHGISFVREITSILFHVIGVIIVIYIFFFYKEEKDIDERIGQILKLLILCVALSFFFRLPVIRESINNQVFRIVSHLIGLISSILLFALVVIYKKFVPSTEKQLDRAALIISITFGIGIVTSLIQLIEITQFAVSGEMTHHSHLFFNLVFILFLVTHASIINFLYRYYQFKFK
jgi:hypothetical protein